jgi:hypothetical protein
VQRSVYLAAHAYAVPFSPSEYRSAVNVCSSNETPPLSPHIKKCTPWPTLDHCQSLVAVVACQYDHYVLVCRNSPEAPTHGGLSRVRS